MERSEIYQLCICNDISCYPEQIYDYLSTLKVEVPDDLSHAIFDAFNDLRPHFAKLRR